MGPYAVLTHIGKKSDYAFPVNSLDKATEAAISAVREALLDKRLNNHRVLSEVRDLDTDDHETVFALEVHDIELDLVSFSDREEPDPKASKNGYAIYIQDTDGKINWYEIMSNLDEKHMAREALMDALNGATLEDQLTMQARLFHEGRLCACAWLEVN